MTKAKLKLATEADVEKAEAAAQVAKCLAEPTRVLLLHLLSQREATVTELVEATGIGQPLVSHHLAIMRLSYLVFGERCGQSVVYRIARNGDRPNPHVATLADVLAAWTKKSR